jgi:hypothetical protein
LSLLISWAVFPALMAVVLLGCGLAVERLAGRALPTSLLLPVGFAAAVVIGCFTTAEPSLAKLTTPGVVLVAIVGLLTAPRTRSWGSPRWPLIAVGLVFLVYAAPIVASGQATFAGFIKLDDTATWMTLTDRVMEHGRDLSGLARSSYFETLSFNISDGYPIGVFLPLGVIHQLLGTDVAWLIQPYMAFLACLLALCLWQLSGWALSSRPLCALVTVIAAQPALLYGYYLWGGIKELAAAALIALAAALGPALVRRETGWRELAPFAFAVGAIVGVLSITGLAWLGPLMVALLVAGVLAIGPAKASARSLIVLAMVAVVIVPTLTGDLTPPTSNPLNDPNAQGNLFYPLSALHVFGIWPAGDFRGSPQLAWLTYVLCALVAAGGLYGVIELVRRKGWGPLLYGGGILLAAGVIGLYGSPWVDGKALATASPAVIFLALLAGALLFSDGRRLAGGAMVAVVAVGVGWSTITAYGGVSLAPRDQLAELEDIGHEIASEGPSLMTEYLPYGVRHFLRDSDAEGASELRYHQIPLLTGSPLRKGLWADTDAFDPNGLQFQTYVLRRSPEQSRPPYPYELTDRGEYYETWERDPSLPYPIAWKGVGGGRGTDVTLDCATIRGLALQAGPGGSLAASSPLEPIFAKRSAVSWPSDWPTSGGDPVPAGGGTMTATIKVPQAGRYEAWLEGSVRSSVVLSIDGEEVGEARHELNNEGMYVDLGGLELEPGSHRLSFEFGGADLHPGSARTVDPLGSIALSGNDPAESRVVKVPVDEAGKLCGKTWDWVEALPPD